MKNADPSLLRAPRLQRGDTIGVLAISSPCERERFSRGIRELEARGFKTKVALDPAAHYASTKYLFSSDSPKRRIEAFHNLLRDGEVKAIVAARGAYGSMELLPLLDLEVWRAHPKPLIGLSDVTALLIAGTNHAGVATVHGPTVESTYSKMSVDDGGRGEHLAAVEELERVLAGSPLSPRPLRALTPSWNGVVEGRAIGGNLSLLTALLGTPWAPNLRGAVLFIEEVGEKPYRIHRMLLQLHLAGAFDGARALVIGDLTNCDITPERAASAPTLEQVIDDIVAMVPCPVVKLENFGHVARNLAVPFGVNCRITATHLEFLESALLPGA